jgi:AraC-like DNA-binding protein
MDMARIIPAPVACVYQEISPLFAMDLPWAQLCLLPASAYSSRQTSQSALLGFAFERQQGVHAIAGDRRHDFDAWPGALALTQPGVEVFSESAQGGEYLTLLLRDDSDASALAAVAQAPRTVLPGQRRVYARSLVLRRLLLSAHPDALLLEEQALGWLADVMATVQPAPHRAPLRAAALTPAALSRVQDWIEAHLDSPLALEDMARIAGLPKLAFLRCFTQYIGMTPHAFVTERRLQHARQALAQGDRSLAEIAMDYGFSHQSHLGALFVRQFGCSPGQYRQRLR